MGLQIRRVTQTKYKLLFASLAIMALAVQPLYGFVASKVANAEAGRTISSSISEVDSSSNLDTSKDVVMSVSMTVKDLDSWSVKFNSNLASALGVDELHGSSLYEQGASADNCDTLSEKINKWLDNPDASDFSDIGTAEASCDGDKVNLSIVLSDTVKDNLPKDVDLVARNLVANYKGASKGTVKGNDLTFQISSKPNTAPVIDKLLDSRTGPALSEYVNVIPTSLHFAVDPSSIDGEVYQYRFQDRYNKGDWSSPKERSHEAATDPEKNPSTWLRNPSKGEGAYEYRISYRTAADGIWSDPSESVSLTHDTTAPTATIDSPNNKYVSGKQDLKISGSYSDNLSGVSSIYLYYKKVDANHNTITGQLPASSGANGDKVKINSDDDTWNFTIPKDYMRSTFSNGDIVRIQAEVHDKAGNVGHFDNYSYYYAIDRTSPEVDVNLSKTSMTEGDSNPTVTITAKDSDSSGIDSKSVIYKVFPRGGDPAKDVVIGWTGGLAKSGDDYTGSVDINKLNPGEYTLRARATDNAGNKTSGADVDFKVNKAVPPQEDGDGISNHDDSEDVDSAKKIDSSGVGPVDGLASSHTPSASSIFNRSYSLNLDADGTESDTDTLGDSTINKPLSEQTDVKGASDDKAGAASMLGLAWYWWLLIVAAVAAIWWWIAAARKRNQDA